MNRAHRAAALDEREYLAAVAKLVEQAWPAGVPCEVRYPLGEIPVTEHLRHAARATPDKACVVYYGYRLTYAELDDASDRFAAFLEACGLVPGDRVAVLLYNCPQYFIVFYGILKLGCVHVPVNPMFKEHELRYQLADADPRVLVAMDRLHPLVEAVRGDTNLEAVVVTRFTDYLPSEPGLPLPKLLQEPPRACPGAVELPELLAGHGPGFTRPAPSLDDLASINYTGGTTGMPKGCMHTQRNMLHACTAGRVTYLRPGASPRDIRTVSYVASFWISGQLRLIETVLTGSTLIYFARWDAEAVLQAIASYRATHLSGPLDTIVELMERPDIERRDLSSLEVTTCTSFVKKLNLGYRRRWRELTGITLHESSFGMTETHTWDTFTTGMQDGDLDLKSTPIFVGLPTAGTRYEIVDRSSGRLVPLGEEGEIVVSSPSLMKGYWRDPEKSAEQIRDGWFRTGDIGMIDERGYLHYLGRDKEMLKVKGMNVYPFELESLLGHHPAIAGSAVVGRADRERGEVPVAFVKLAPGCEATTGEEIGAWCRDNMATYKLPEIRIVAEFPLTEVGKVSKARLRQWLRDGAADTEVASAYQVST
ncbi:MAG: AMP-binding protein [Spirochaetaceae bacterium]|nr:AMP-binding protein [Spirochaetaceae bacterium]